MVREVDTKGTAIHRIMGMGNTVFKKWVQLIIVCSLPMTLISCSPSPPGGGKMETIPGKMEKSGIEVSSEAGDVAGGTLTRVSLLPKTATVGSSLTMNLLTHRGAEPGEYDILWYVNGELVRRGGATFDLLTFRKGDRVAAEARPRGGAGKKTFLDAVVIKNSKPEITDFHYETEVVKGTYLFRVRAEALDADRDPVSLSYRFFVNDLLVEESRSGDLDISSLKRNDRIYCVIAASDGEDFPTEMPTPLFTISNRPPAIVSTPPARVAGSIFTYTIAGSDPDGDEIAFELVQGPEGMVITGDTLHWDLRGNGVSIPVKTVVRADDGHGGMASQEFTLSAKPK